MTLQSLTLQDFSENSISELRRYIDGGGRFVVLQPSVPKGPLPIELPEYILITDLRYGGVTYIRGNHPRIEGIWTQYSHLDTGLARNITLSHTITDQTPIENWKSEPHAMQLAPVGALQSEDYRHQHNHYQNFHSEVHNFSANLNGVAIWGDSGAFVPGAKSWGAFFSARSWPVKWNGYTPADCFAYREEDFDAALVGVEVDVLNAGLDWGSQSTLLPTSMAKVGIQIVGFGKKNTAAIEIRSEDSDDPHRGPDNRRGAWYWGIIIRGSLASDSTVLMAENGRIRRGIDFEMTTFSEGALRVTGNGPGSGIVFDAGWGGEIYTEEQHGRRLANIRVGTAGLRVLDSSGKTVLLEITDDGVKIHKYAR